VSVIDTTSNHLFWAPYPHYGRIPAKQLKPGMHLKTPDGQPAVVVGGSVPAVHDGWMWDLTVPGNGDHDFYVEPAGNGGNTYDVAAATTAILVHNCTLPTPRVSNSKLQNLANYLYKGTGNPNLIGDGTTMSAAQSEVAGGDLVEGSNHIIKAQESIRALSNWMTRNPDASGSDMLVARSLQNLLNDALNQNYMDGTENYVGGMP
jgi:hypothetical protein